MAGYSVGCQSIRATGWYVSSWRVCAIGLYFGKLGQPNGRRQIPLPGKFSWELALTDWIADKMANYLLLTLTSALV